MFSTLLLLVLVYAIIGYLIYSIVEPTLKQVDEILSKRLKPEELKAMRTARILAYVFWPLILAILGLSYLVDFINFIQRKATEK